MREAIGVVWFNSRSTVGIVITINEVKEKKAYIGSATGLNQDLDIQSIANFGAKFPLDTAEQLIKSLGLPINLKL